MSRATSDTRPSASTTLPIPALAESFAVSLSAARKSPRTIQTYLESVRLFDAFLVARGMPRNSGAVRREHVEAFIVDLLERYAPATASNRYRGLQSFWKWAVEQDEISTSPMAKMTPPAVPEKAVPVIGLEKLRALLRVCEGKDFAQRRDMAIIRLFLDTGARRAELAALTVEDIDVMGRTAVIRHGKGDKHRVGNFSPRTANALDRYLRARRAHRLAEIIVRDGRGEPLGHPLWLGTRGPLTDNGIFQLIQARGEEAGLGRIHPHQLRHTWASRWLASGGSEGNLMSLAGWSSRQMVDRYGRSAAGERAREAYQRSGFNDDL